MASFKRSTQALSRRMVASKTGAFCIRSCPFSSPSSSFTSRNLQNWTRSVSRNASESGWKRSNRRSRKTPVHPREPRVAAVSGFTDTAGRVPTESPKTGRCAAVRERWRKMLVLARTAAGKAACGKCGNTPKWEESGDFGRCGEKAGESQGVVRAPWRTHLPAVRAVLGFHAGVFERAKIVPLGSEAQIITLFQGKQRGHTQNWREISMANRKIKFPLWLMPETKATVERL